MQLTSISQVKSRILSITLMIIASSMITFSNGLNAAGYVITDLGSVVEEGSKYAEAESINNNRQVTGYVRWETGVSYILEVSPFIYDGTQIHDLSSQIGTGAFAYGINELGAITGTNGRAFFYDGYSLQDIGTLGGQESTGYAINDHGEVAGTSEFSNTSSDERAFYYDGETMNDLGTLGGDVSRAYDINIFGEIVGRSLIQGPSDVWNPDVMHAFIYSNNQMIDLGTLGNGDEDESYANAINDFGQVTGSSDIGNGRSHAFLYENGIMRDLGTLGGDYAYGSGINNDGHVVGGSGNYNGKVTAFLYDGTEMRNICDLTDCSAQGWTWLQTAKDINDSGCITGEGLIDGESHMFMVSWTDAPIAELCTDGIDNDHDGLTDCDDVQDCGQSISCFVPDEMAYGLIDLGTLGGDYSQGVSVNNVGNVTGDSQTRNDGTHAFYYNGNMQDLGKLAINDTSSHGRGINDNGQITGYSVSPGAPYDDAYNKLFLYENGNLINLHTLFGDDCDESVGDAINNSGQITGWCRIHVYDMWSDELSYAFIYDGNNMIMLSSGWNQSYGRSLNDSGLVTGSHQFDSGYSHAFIYDGAMQDLGTLGGTYSSGYDINNLGHVTGFSVLEDNKSHAFFYDGVTMHDLGAFEGGGSTGFAINDNDQIVGSSERANGEDTAFIYHDGRMISVCALTDCKDKGWTSLTSGLDINNRGDITGIGLIEGEIHAFLAPAGDQPPQPEICNDGIDNDGDGLTDCEDTQDCSSDPGCSAPPPEPEICNDGIDNDGDGLVDCLDKLDCRQDPTCKKGGGGSGGGGSGSGGGGGKNK